MYSLKIEGRMKNVTYAAYVTSVYRHYVDEYIISGSIGRAHISLGLNAKELSLSLI